MWTKKGYRMVQGFDMFWTTARWWFGWWWFAFLDDHHHQWGIFGRNLVVTRCLHCPHCRSCLKWNSQGRISRSYVICKGKWQLNDNFSSIFFWRLWNFNSLIKTMDTSWEVEKNFSAILTNWSIWALSLIRFLWAMFGAPDVCWKTGTQNFQKERQPEGFHL